MRRRAGVRGCSATRLQDVGIGNLAPGSRSSQGAHPSHHRRPAQHHARAGTASLSLPAPHVPISICRSARCRLRLDRASETWSHNDQDFNVTLKIEVAVVPVGGLLTPQSSPLCSEPARTQSGSGRAEGRTDSSCTSVLRRSTASATSEPSSTLMISRWDPRALDVKVPRPAPIVGRRSTAPSVPATRCRWRSWWWCLWRCRCRSC